MARLERKSLTRYDTVAAVSGRDQDVLAKRYRLLAADAIETGVDLDFFAMNPRQATPEPKQTPIG